MAESHKLKGNEFFRNKEYANAIEEYGKAILKDPTNSIYYTNRAMAEIKLEKYDQVVADCQRAIELGSTFKAYYYLGLAQTEIGILRKAEENLITGYDMALKDKSPSAPAICQAILNVRKKVWEDREKRRLAQVAPLLIEVEDMFAAKLEKELQVAEKTLSGEELADEREYLQSEHDKKLETVRTIFSRANEKYARKEVPDYLTDPISFNLFVDPVISKSGNSFERSWILQHLKTSSTDPFSRQPLTADDLIPNIQLKAAAEDFIQKEGTF